jgi:hypothetical protein
MTGSSLMLAREDVQRKLRERGRARELRTAVTIDDTVLRLARIAKADIRDFFTPAGHLLHPDEWPEDIATAVQSVDVVTRRTSEKDEDGHPIIEEVTKIRLEPRKAALDSILRHLGGFNGNAGAHGEEHDAPALSELEFATMIRFLFEEVKRKQGTMGEGMSTRTEVTTSIGALPSPACARMIRDCKPRADFVESK